MVGHSLEHSFRALGLGLGATKIEVKVAYRALARIYHYHPDKHDSTRTGMMHEAASEYFKIINNAQSYLCKVL